MYWQDLRSEELDLGALTPVSLTLTRFLTTTTCPEEWLELDLYVFRDDSTAFYVGQSDCAFARVWTHLQDGFKGRSTVGKFVRVNWPGSMRFTIDLFCSDAPAFAPLQQSRDNVERTLIRDLRPCFNRTHNVAPAPLPEGYASPRQTTKYPRNMRTIMREAERAVSQAGNISTWGLIEQRDD